MSGRNEVLSILNKTKLDDGWLSLDEIFDRTRVPYARLSITTWIRDLKRAGKIISLYDRPTCHQKFKSLTWEGN